MIYYVGTLGRSTKIIKSKYEKMRTADFKNMLCLSEKSWEH